MPTLDTVFIIIISITVLSVILSIVDWIYLSSLASKMTLLEREIEKRSSEFDSLKKEITLNSSPAIGGASVIESNEPFPDNLPTILSNEDTIQIVRNVRGSFHQSTTSPSIESPPLPQDSLLATEEQDTIPSNYSVVPQSEVEGNGEESAVQLTHSPTLVNESVNIIYSPLLSESFLIKPA